MEQLVFQMFITGCGEKMDEALSKGLGGIIFFTNDIKTESQFKKLIHDIKLKSLIPPFLAIDQEGGRVERTENIRPRRLSAKEAFTLGDNFLKKQSEEISRELRYWGLNLNFAPCADVNTNPENPIIGVRSFADNPDDVIKGMKIFTEASRKYGIIPCVKHFPGHGDASKDSHLTLPDIDLPLDEMEKVHIKPFKAAIEDGIEMIMVAHLHCTCFDKEIIPASLSGNAIGFLRNELKYDGIIITDDMIMKGVAQYKGTDACIRALNAGADMFIFREADSKTFKIIQNLSEIVGKNKKLREKILKSNFRIKKLKTKYKF